MNGIMEITAKNANMKTRNEWKFNIFSLVLFLTLLMTVVKFYTIQRQTRQQQNKY